MLGQRYKNYVTLIFSLASLLGQLYKKLCYILIFSVASLWPIGSRCQNIPERWSVPSPLASLTGPPTLEQLPWLRRYLTFDLYTFFLKMGNRCHFFAYFWSFQTQILPKNWRRQHDSNSDCQSRRQARWPLDPHHYPHSTYISLAIRNLKFFIFELFKSCTHKFVVSSLDWWECIRHRHRLNIFWPLPAPFVAFQIYCSIST